MSQFNTTRRSILKAVSAGAAATGLGIGAIPDTVTATGHCVACGDGDADKVGELTFEYQGEDSITVTAYNDKDAKSEDLLDSYAVSPSDRKFVVQAPSDKGEFDTEISLWVDGSAVAQFHTSCSQPIGPGIQKGDFAITDGKDSTGATLCEAECALCGDGGDAGDVSQLELSYGGSGGTIAVYNDKEAKSDAVLFEGAPPSDSFTVSASDVGEDKLKSDISFYVDGSKHATLHTSCSQPLYPGLTARDFTIEGGRTKNGRALCSPDDLGCAECGDGDADGVTSARLEYVGDRTSGTLAVYNDKEAKADALLDSVELGDGEGVLSFSASDVDEDELKSDIGVFVDGDRIATFHTSCSQPFGPGIQKGGVRVIEATTSMGRALCELECLECGGDGDADGVSDATLEYTGERTSGIVRVYNDNEAKTDALLASIDLSETKTISLSASTVDEDELKSDISVFIGDEKNAEFHTSCSQPFGVGVQKGDFEVTGGFTTAGAELCPAGCANCRSGGDADGVASLELEFDGDSEAFVQVYNDKEAKDDAVLFEGFVGPDSPDNVVEFSASILGEDELKSDISVYVDSELDAIFHTSCSQALGPGVERGSFTVVGGTDKAGRELCDVAAGECVTCGDGGDADDVRELTLKYTGTESSFIEVVNDKDFDEENVLFAQTIEPGSSDPHTDATFTFRAPPDDDKLSSDISVFVNGEESPNAVIHTSCSQPLGPGQQFGDFTIVAGEDRVGRKLCEIECAICGGDTEGIKADDVSQLELGYLGNSPARVRVYNDKDMKEDALLFDSETYDEDGQLDRGDVFEIFASAVGEEKLKSDISFFVDGSKETLHTSCSRPLGPGVRTSGGTFVVTDGRDRAGLRLCPGGGDGGQLSLCPPNQTALARYTVDGDDITFVEGRDELEIGPDSVTFSNIQTNDVGEIIGFTLTSGPYDLGSVTVRFGNRVDRFDPNDPDFGTGPGSSDEFPDADGPETTIVDLTRRVDGTPEGITDILLCAPVFWQVDLWFGEISIPPEQPVTFPSGQGRSIIAGTGSNPAGIPGVTIRNPGFDGRTRDLWADLLEVPGEFDIDFDTDTLSLEVTLKDTASESQTLTLGVFEMPGLFRRDELVLQTQTFFDADQREFSPGETKRLEIDLPTP